jgi:hypothetical protein
MIPSMTYTWDGLHELSQIWTFSFSDYLVCCCAIGVGVLAWGAWRRNCRAD